MGGIRRLTIEPKSHRGQLSFVDGKKAKLAAKYLVENIEARDNHLSTGFIGTKDLMLALAKIGRNDVVYRLIHNNTFPSWGFSIKHGTTRKALDPAYFNQADAKDASIRPNFRFCSRQPDRGQGRLHQRQPDQGRGKSVLSSPDDISHPDPSKVHLADPDPH